MKKVLKILLIIVLVAGIGVGAYFLFFHVDRNLSVYRNVNNVMQYRYNIDYDNEIIDFVSLGYNNNTEQFNETDHLEVIKLKQKIFSNELISGGKIKGQDFNYYGYYCYDYIMADGIKYYSNYASLADSAKLSSSSKVNGSVNEFKVSMTKLSNAIIVLADLQNRLGVKDSTVTVQEIENSYGNLRVLYREYLQKEASLLLNLRDFVISESFDNNYSFESVAMLYDSIAGIVNTAMINDKDQEINYLHDASLYIDLYLSYISGEEISYGITDELGYLQAYNQLYYKDRNDYNLIYEFTHFQKQDLLHGDKGIGSMIQVGYEEIVIVIMSILGL